MSKITELVLTKDYKRDVKKLTAELLSGGEYNEVLHCLHNGITLPEIYGIVDKIVADLSKTMPSGQNSC